MICSKQKNLPELFGWLMERGCFGDEAICATADGFYAVRTSVAELLAHHGITTVPGDQGNALECGLFFDDWYPYAIADGDAWVYSLFKMREQEYDAKLGRKADGDIPGVTVPFISLQTEILRACLLEPTEENRRRLNKEINRVVAARGQRHDAALKGYFTRTEAQAPYLIAQLYTGYIASLAENGCLSVPESYAAYYTKRGRGSRLPRFIEENNRVAGKVICDHERICIGDPLEPTEQERLAILATHTGNTSVFSFAAEVQFHAKFLTAWARISLPVIGGSPYESAIRADMSVGDAEFVGPTPYYRMGSSIVQKQYHCHKDDL